MSSGYSARQGDTIHRGNNGCKQGPEGEEGIKRPILSAAPSPESCTHKASTPTRRGLQKTYNGPRQERRQQRAHRARPTAPLRRPQPTPPLQTTFLIHSNHSVLTALESSSANTKYFQCADDTHFHHHSHFPSELLIPLITTVPCQLGALWLHFDSSESITV